jgi:hypothetical protein
MKIPKYNPEAREDILLIVVFLICLVAMYLGIPE